MTSQSRDKAAGIIIDKNSVVPDVASQLQGLTYYNTDSSRVDKLESDMEFLRSIITELYNKCPKTMVNMSKKKKKEDTVECENCGGLLW